MRVGPQAHALEAFWANEPAHQPAAPEELLEDRHESHGAYDAKRYKYGIAPEIRRRGAPRRADQRVVEEPMTPVGWPEHVGHDPEHEHGSANQDAACPVARAEGDQ